MRDGLAGQVVEARGEFVRKGAHCQGQVSADGEVWSARCEQPSAVIAAGDRLRVLSRDGLTLLVEPEAASPDSD